MHTSSTRSPRSTRKWLAAAASSTALGAALLAGPVSANAQSLSAAATASPFRFSSVAWTGQNTVVAATDDRGDLYCYIRPPGSAKWVTELVAPGTGSHSSYEPSIGWTGQAVVIAATDQLGDLVYFSAGAGSPTWTEQTLATSDGGRFAFQDPSLTVAANGEVLITASTTSNDLESFTLTPGNSWVERLVAGGPFSTSSVTTTHGLALVTASDGVPGVLYMWYESLSSPGWHKEIVASGDGTHNYTGGSITANASNIWITAYNAHNGGLLSYTQPIGGSGWTEHDVSDSFLGGENAPVTWTGPAAGGSGYDVITDTSSTGALDYWWSSAGTTASWHSETIAASATKAKYTSPTITATAASVDVADINVKSGYIYNWYQPFGTTHWNKQLVAKG